VLTKLWHEASACCTKPDVSTVTVVLVSAFTYALFGYIGHQFSPSAGFLTPFWPAAGIAIICHFVYGPRSMAGVFIGAYVVNYYILLQTQINPTFVLSNLLLPASSAIGAVLQVMLACVGVRYITANKQTQTNAATYLKVALVAGPVSCIVNASISVGLLGYLGVIESNSMLDNWINRWAGDSLGVIFLLPFCVILAPQRFNVLKLNIRRRFTQVLGVALTSLFLAILSIVELTDKLRTELITNSIKIEQSILENFKRLEADLTSKKSFFNSSAFVTATEYYRFVSPMLGRDSPVRSVSVYEVGPASDLDKIEQFVKRTQSFKNYSLPPITAKADNLIAVKVLTEPNGAQRSNIGALFDTNLWGSLSLDTLFEDGQFKLNKPTKNNGEYSSHLVMPIFNGLGELSQILSLEFSIEQLIAPYLSTLPQGIAVYLIDDLENKRSPIVFNSRIDQPSNAKHQLNTSNGIDSISKTLDLHNRNWTLTIHRYGLSPSGTFSSIALFILTLLIGSVISASTIFIGSRNQEIERLITERTQELEHLLTALKESEKQHDIARLEAEKANSAKSDFLANMSHELRTPLNGLIGMLSLLDSPSATEKQREILKIARSSGATLLALIGEILDISALESQRLKLKLAPFDLDRMLNELDAHFNLMAKAKGIEFRCKRNLSVSQAYLGDALRIQQILNNLLSNAVKFTSTGTITLELSDTRISDKRTALNIRVLDTGIGVSAEQQRNLFQRFSQADSSSTRQYGGSGLGLAISKQLAELMGGSLEMKSEIGVGTEVLFKLELETSESAIETPSDTEVEQAKLALSGKRALVVDDSPLNLIVARGLLERLGLHIVEASNGVEAIERLKQEPVDLVLMDCQMPVMDGLTASRLIRSGSDILDPRVPIIAVTANTLEENWAECSAAGMDAFLSKPLTLERLSLSLLELLEKSHAKSTQADSSINKPN